MSQPAILVEGLWKDYVVHHERARHGTFYELLAAGIKAPWKRLTGDGGQAAASSESEVFSALRDVNFSVESGQVVGVMGRNGAGKSTLLKVLSRITAPTRGKVTIHGRLSSLLEVGTGFHPELTGRENIFLNGAVLGMSRREVTKKFDEIVAFAEVDRFLDTPVKRYSSGMYVRLAFAVAAHLDTDVLMIDEVLAVGDAAFQDKCIKKMDGLSNGGRTVLFVSHSASSVSRICNKGLILSAGEAKFFGPVDEALTLYGKVSNQAKSIEATSSRGNLIEIIEFSEIKINKENTTFGSVVDPLEDVEIELFFKSRQTVRQFRINLHINKESNFLVGIHDVAEPLDLKSGRYVSTFRMPKKFLSPGEYNLEILAYSNSSSDWVISKNAAFFTVANKWSPGYEPSHEMGLINMSGSGKRVALD